MEPNEESVEELSALDDLDTNPDDLAGELVDPEHDLDVATFEEEDEE